MSSVCGIGFGKEATYAEDVAATKWVPATDVNWSMKRNHVFAKTVGHLGQKYGMVGLFEPSGTFTIVGRAGDLGEILHALYGAVSTVDNTGSYTHTFTPHGAPPTYTFHIVDPDVPDGQETFPGWYPTEVKPSFKAGDHVQITVSWTAQTVNLDAAGSPTFGTDPALVMLTSGDYVKLDTVADSYINAAEVTVKREYPSIDQASVIGSMLRKVAGAGLMSMDMKHDRIFFDQVAQKHFLGGAAVTEPATVENPRAVDILSLSETAVSGAFYWSLQVLADAMFADSRDRGQKAQDLQVENINFVAQDDDSANWISMLITNEATTY